MNLSSFSQQNNNKKMNVLQTFHHHILHNKIVYYYNRRHPILLCVNPENDNKLCVSYVETLMIFYFCDRNSLNSLT